MSSIAARRANKRVCPLQPNGILSRGTHGILAQMGVILDYDTAGNLISPEILDASRRMTRPSRIDYQVGSPSA